MKQTGIELDFRSEAPIYEQIAEQVRGWIGRGTLRPGDRLPTVRRLALELRVNFNTVARAYRILDRAGVISTQQGRGTYILAVGEAEERVRRAELEELAGEFTALARRLGYSDPQILEAVRAELENHREQTH